MIAVRIKRHLWWCYGVEAFPASLSEIRCGFLSQRTRDEGLCLYASRLYAPETLFFFVVSMEKLFEKQSCCGRFVTHVTTLGCTYRVPYHHVTREWFTSFYDLGAGWQHSWQRMNQQGVLFSKQRPIGIETWSCIRVCNRTSCLSQCYCKNLEGYG